MVFFNMFRLQLYFSNSFFVCPFTFLGYVTGADIGRMVTEHTGEVLNSKDTDEFLKIRSSGESSSAPEVDLSNFSKLFTGLKHKHYPRGHYIFHAGEEGSSMYFLTSGKVEIQTRKGQLVSILRSGDFFGEGSLLDKSNRFTTAKCATPVDVIEIKADDFDRYTRTSSETMNELKRKWRARNLVYAKNLLRLERSVKTRTLQKGEVIYREGDVGTSMFRVDDSGGGCLFAALLSLWKLHLLCCALRSHFHCDLS